MSNSDLNIINAKLLEMQLEEQKKGPCKKICPMCKENIPKEYKYCGEDCKRRHKIYLKNAEWKDGEYKEPPKPTRQQADRFHKGYAYSDSPVQERRFKACRG